MQTIRDWFARFFGNPMSDAELRRIVIDAEKKFMKGELGSVNKNKPVLDNDPSMKGWNATYELSIALLYRY